MSERIKVVDRVDNSVAAQLFASDDHFKSASVGKKDMLMNNEALIVECGSAKGGKVKVGKFTLDIAAGDTVIIMGSYVGDLPVDISFEGRYAVVANPSRKIIQELLRTKNVRTFYFKPDRKFS